MEVLLFILLAVVGVALIGMARRFGKKYLWGRATDKMNEKTLQDLQKFLKETENEKESGQ